MTTLMTYLSAFGLASGAGAKACIPILALGGFHYTPYFELSERFLWIADPAVMVVLGVLVVLEVAVDAHPDLGAWSDAVSYLPKLVAGFIGFAAVVGTVDSNLAALAASGLLGAGTAAGIHWTRNRVRLPFRDAAEDLHEGLGKAASLSEAGVSATLSGTAVLAPPLSAVLAVGLGAGALVAGRAVAGRRLPCVHCGEPIRPGALVCVHCGREQPG
jgi:hypothetical protein